MIINRYSEVPTEAASLLPPADAELEELEKMVRKSNERTAQIGRADLRKHALSLAVFSPEEATEATLARAEAYFAFLTEESKTS